MPKFTGPRPLQPVLTWTRGEELPPFEPGIAEAVALALTLASDRAPRQVPVRGSQAVVIPRHASPRARTDAPGHLQELHFSKTQADSNVTEHFFMQVFGPSAGFRPVGAHAGLSGLLLQGLHCVALKTYGPGGALAASDSMCTRTCLFRFHIRLDHRFEPTPRPAPPLLTH